MSNHPENLWFSEKRAFGSTGLARAPGLLFVADGLGVVVVMGLLAGPGIECAVFRRPYAEAQAV